MSSENSQNNLPLLSADDAMMDLQLRCATQSQPDVEQELARFLSERKPQGHAESPSDSHVESEEKMSGVSHKRVYIKYAVVISVAAILLAVFLFPWQKSTENKEEVIAESVNYVSPPAQEGISITVGNKTIVPGSAEASSTGVTVNSNNVIRFLSSDNVAPEDRTVITIPQGQVARLVLPDGTNVCLSARSRLIFPQKFLANAPREVSLIGEGYFEVTHDEKRPFLVHSGNTVTRVLGTCFNIRSFEGEPQRITLVHGSVAVSPDVSQIGGKAYSQEQRVLKPGQQLTASSSHFSVSDVDTEEVIGWKDGLFAFGQETLHDVLVEIARWYNVNVRFDNESQINEYIHYNGERTSSLKEIIGQLNAFCDTKITLEGNTMVVK